MAAVVAAVCCLAVCAAATTADSQSLAYKQEEPAFSALPTVPADMTAEDVFMSSFVEIKGDGMRKTSRAMAAKFVDDLRVALKKLYPAKGALSGAARSSAAGFDKNFREQCRAVSPSPKMCRNFVTIYRLQFAGANPFAAANRKRFEDAVRNVILRWVAAWRQQHPKRSRKAGGNPWSAALRGDTDERVDPLRNTRLSTRVRGGLNRFGRLNVGTSAAEKYLGVSPKGDWPLGSALDDPYDKSKPYKVPRHVKALREQLQEDLAYLRDKVYEKLSDKKFHRMIGNPKKAPNAILRTARICRREKKNRFFPPTFCRAVEYLASTNFVGRNFLRAKADFSALLASFMDHNHKQTTRYGWRVIRKPNYRQDVTAITAKFALKLRANRFNLRTFSRELVNMISNVMAVPRSRIRIASVRFGGYNRSGRRNTKVTFEFLPKKGDRRIRSRPYAVGSVDSLAEQFRAMALNRPGSDFYKVPLLSRLLPKSMILSKTLGRRPKSMARYNLQSANKTPRFAEAEAGQTVATEMDVSADEEVAAGMSEHDGELMELEAQDEEYTDSDAAVDAADTEAEAAADAEAEADSDAAEAEGAAQDAADADAEMTDAERAELSAAEAAGEVAFLELGAAQAERDAQDAAAEAAAEAAAQLHGTDADAADVDAQTAALHLDADTVTAEEEESEADESDEAAEADEAEESADSDESEADAAEAAADAADEAEDAEADADAEAEGVSLLEAGAAARDADESEDEEADEDEGEEEADAEADEAAAAWHTAMMQQSEQLVLADESEDESVEELFADIDAAEEAEEAEADTDSAEDDAEDEGAAERSAAENSAAPTAPAESLPALPEVNAQPDTDAALKSQVSADAKAAAANAAVKAAIASVDASEDAVFLETHTKVTAQTLRDPSSAAAVAPVMAVAAAALLLALAAQQ